MTTLEDYRDDGAVASLLRRELPGPAILVALAGLAAVAVGVATADRDVALPAFAVFVVVGLWSASTRLDARLGWLVPPVLRIGEYGLVLWATLWGVVDSPGLAFAYLAAVAFHHYDIVYRTRHQRVAPPGWVQIAGGGWELRTVVLLASTLLGVLDVALGVLAAWCGLLYVSESLVSWIRVARDEAREVSQSLEDEEDIF